MACAACVDTNECHAFACDGAQTCENLPGTYKCVCEPPNLHNVCKYAAITVEHVSSCRSPVLIAVRGGAQEDGTCSFAADVEAARTVKEEIRQHTAASVSAAHPDHTEKGSSIVGSSVGWAKLVSVTFKTRRFESVPVVTDISTKNECCGDQVSRHCILLLFDSYLPPRATPSLFINDCSSSYPPPSPIHYHSSPQFSFTAVNIHTKGFDILVERSDSQSGWGQELAVEWLAFDPKMGVDDAAADDQPTEQPTDQPTEQLFKDEL